MTWWQGILVGACGVLFIEFLVISIFGILLGKEIHEECENANNTFYPADYEEDIYE